MTTGGTAELVRLVLTGGGGSRILVAGPGREEGDALALARALRLEGVDAHAVPDPAVLPFAKGICDTDAFDAPPFDTVVALKLTPLDADALASLRRASRAAVLVLATGQNRAWWDARAFAAGLRRHPLWSRMVPFGELDTEDGFTLLYERLPDPTLPPPAFDGLLASTRRADALAAAWHLAAEVVGPGQRVLIAACGSGWGASILARRTEAAAFVGLAADEALADHAARQYGALDPRLSFACGLAPDEPPFDVMVAIDPPEAATVVATAHGTLRPGGRLVLALPVSGAGSWQGLRARFDDDLAIDRQFSIKEGCGPREPDAPRELIETDPAEPGPDLADWAVVVAVKSPFAALDPAEKQARAAAERFHVRAWWRDYDNPYLVETLVNLGSRVHSRRLLAAWTARAAREARPGSPDQGAALCVQAYRSVEDASASWPQVEAHLERMARWQAEADPSPHAGRWRVSLHYAAALLWLAGGRLAEARDAFAACAAEDVRDFSATLGTKTVSACLKAGRLSLTLGEPEAAREFWQRGMMEARRLLQGDWSNVWGDPDRPFWVETREVADVVDLAMDCANALNSLDTHALQPGLLHEKLVWGRAGFPGRIDTLERLQAALHSEVFQLQQDKRGLMGEVGGLTLKLLTQRGATHLAAGRHEPARACFQAAEQRDGLWGVWFRAMALLGHGLLADGWADYARRFDLGRARARPALAPEWQGEDMTGRRLLVWREQGLGDELMFASCYGDLLAAAAEVVIECDPRLVDLFARSFPVATVRADTGEPIAGVDLHVPAGSLPRWLRPTLDRFPATASYLKADPGKVALWRRRLADLGPGPVIGLCWRGGRPRAPFPPLERWAPVLTRPGVRVVSLQYAPDEAEVAVAEAALGVRLHRWDDLDPTNDLDGLAALMTALDLVITAPTSVGDLAGALGVPVWRCGWDEDWAMLGTDHRPWYPSMRLFLAPPAEALDGVIDRVAASLDGFL